MTPSAQQCGSPGSSCDQKSPWKMLNGNSHHSDFHPHKFLHKKSRKKSGSEICNGMPKPEDRRKTFFNGKTCKSCSRVVCKASSKVLGSFGCFQYRQQDGFPTKFRQFPTLVKIQVLQITSKNIDISKSPHFGGGFQFLSTKNRASQDLQAEGRL